MKNTKYLNTVNVLICIQLVFAGIVSFLNLYTTIHKLNLVISIFLILSGFLSIVFLKFQEKLTFSKKNNIALAIFAILIGFILSNEVELNSFQTSFYIGIYMVLYALLSLDFKIVNFSPKSPKEFTILSFLFIQFIIGSVLVLMPEIVNINENIIFSCCFFINSFSIYQSNTNEINILKYQET